MGILEKFNQGKGKIRDRCVKNPETGDIVCKRTRVHSNGTEEEIAGFTMSTDGSCNATSVDSFENEEGQLDQLEKKFVPKMIAKCRNTPQDY